jgi:hypothetical protein
MKVIEAFHKCTALITTTSLIDPKNLKIPLVMIAAVVTFRQRKGSLGGEWKRVSH